MYNPWNVVPQKVKNNLQPFPWDRGPEKVWINPKIFKNLHQTETNQRIICSIVLCVGEVRPVTQKESILNINPYLELNATVWVGREELCVLWNVPFLIKSAPNTDIFDHLKILNKFG
jgi:hypothetical protein